MIREIFFSAVLTGMAMAIEAQDKMPVKFGKVTPDDFKMTAAVRTYPVEMPCGMDETYTMMMDIPSGYVVDEVPKSAKVLFNTDEGFFEYFVVKDDKQVQMRSRIKLKKANFAPDDYSTLRDFFAFIVKKEEEQIVFKKKK